MYYQRQLRLKLERDLLREKHTSINRLLLQIVPLVSDTTTKYNNDSNNNIRLFSYFNNDSVHQWKLGFRKIRIIQWCETQNKNQL